MLNLHQIIHFYAKKDYININIQSLINVKNPAAKLCLGTNMCVLGGTQINTSESSTAQGNSVGLTKECKGRKK